MILNIHILVHFSSFIDPLASGRATNLKSLFFSKHRDNIHYNILID